MTRYLISILILCFFISCSSNNEKNNPGGKDSLNNKKADSTSLKMLGYYTIDGDSVIIPTFEIQLKLSPKAEQKLKDSKETIIVDASFSGDQKEDTASQEYFFVAQAQKELTDTRVAKFEGIKFSRSKYDALADKDILVLINVYSGRRSTSLNILSCGIVEDKMSMIKNKTSTITGKLISGDN